MKKRKVIDEGPSLFPEWNEEAETEAEPAIEEVQTKIYDHTALFERLAPSAF